MKPLFVISCPIDTYSGYGARSRDIAKVVIKSGKYNVKIIPQRWGNTPFGFLQETNQEHKEILDCVLVGNQLPAQPDIWMQITIPSEFQPIGKYNIGVTAGIETNTCSMIWIEGANRMNLVLTSSVHSKNVLENTVYTKNDATGKPTNEQVKTTTQIEVLFEGVDTNIYKFISESKGELSNILNEEIKEDFNFLFVGHWLQGNLGCDRKDVGMLIKTFLETFKGKKLRPGLILKTQSANASVMDREEILNKIRKIEELVGGNDLPNVYLLHGELTDEEINELYNHPKVKSFVTFTKGEGFGRPLLESSVVQKPVIAPSYSGQLDFLNPEMSILLPGQLVQIHPSAVVKDLLIPESGWFTINYKIASDKLKEVFENYKKFIDNARRQSYLSKTNFSLEKMGEKLLTILDEKAPKTVQLQLPKLKRIQENVIEPKNDNV